MQNNIIEIIEKLDQLRYSLPNTYDTQEDKEKASELFTRIDNLKKIFKITFSEINLIEKQVGKLKLNRKV